MAKICKKLLWAAGTTFGVISFFTLVTNGIVLSYGHSIAEYEVPSHSIALVFGGGMKPDGSMSDMQMDRVKKGIELYKGGKVQKLLMTGDDGAMYADEVGAMRAYAIEHGVPEIDVAVDPHGYRTYESCDRAHDVFGLTKVIAVSQAFHLPRITYLCHHLGVQVIGVPAEFHIEPWPRAKNVVREVLARVKAWIDINVATPGPKVKM